MGILGLLLGRATIAKYEIIFDDEDRIIVKIIPETPPIKQEYIRLFGLFISKVIYNFGGSQSQATEALITYLQSSLINGISPTLNCFKAADIEDVVKYSSSLPKNIITKISGDFFSWKNGSRTITTKVPLNITEQQTVFGALALLQFAINKNKDNLDNLKILETMLDIMLDTFINGGGSNMNEISQIPDYAFLKASGA